MPRATPQTRRAAAWRRTVRRFAELHPQHAGGVRFDGRTPLLTRTVALAFFVWLDSLPDCSLTPYAAAALAVLTASRHGTSRPRKTEDNEEGDWG